MKYFFLLLMLVPGCLLAQSNRSSLSEYGIQASMTTDSTLPVKRIEQQESDLKTNRVKIYLENGERITITELNQKMNLATIKKQFNQLLSTKHAGVSIKALIKSGNDLLIERTRLDSGKKIYKFMLLCVIKGKEYMMDCSEMDDEALCRQVMQLAKSIK